MSLAPEHIETGRLIGRRVQQDDYDHYHRLQNNPEVAKTLGGIPTDETIRMRVDSAVGHWAAHEFGEYVLFDKTDLDSFAGRAFLRHKLIDGESAIELGYAYMPAFWGQNHGTEVAGVLMQQAFEVLGVDNVLSFTLVTNIASRRVMEKNGFRFSHEGVYAGFPHVFLRLTREDWLKRTGSKK